MTFAPSNMFADFNALLPFGQKNGAGVRESQGFEQDVFFLDDSWVFISRRRCPGILPL